MKEGEVRPFQRRDGERGHVVATDGVRRVFIELGKDFQVSPEYYDHSKTEVEEKYGNFLENFSFLETQYIQNRIKQKQKKNIRALARRMSKTLRSQEKDRKAVDLLGLTVAIRKLMVGQSIQDGRFSNLTTREQSVLLTVYFPEVPRSNSETASLIEISDRNIRFVHTRAINRLAKLRIEPEIPIDVAILEINKTPLAKKEDYSTREINPTLLKQIA